MKRWTISIILLVTFLLSGCVLPSSTPPAGESVKPTLSDVEMQTQIALMLTTMPTATPEQVSAPTATLPAVITASKPQPTSIPTATPVSEAPTPTPLPPTPTELPTQTAPTLTATPAGPTPTISPDDPRNRLGSPTDTDSMDDSTRWNWPTGSSEFTSIEFRNGQMILTGLQTKLGWRIANPRGEAFSNLYLEMVVKADSCTGNNQFGMIVRVPVLKDANQGYLFSIRCDGKYSLRKWDGTVGEKGTLTRLKDWTTSTAINTGANATNRLGLMMIGNRLIMYINGTLLGEVSDDSFLSGYFGVYAASGSSAESFSIAVDEMSYWLNPQP
ncbi:MULTISPECIES: hypothetical protein [Anaerolinea]|uniref:hypothetical protein n=1 Tax=Anaerolinea TaxID=233189 RepID=UPI00262F0348|nr:hypothetical protein [Anaerolinea thermophila]